MGYALNLCKFHIYNVPYNHNITEEGIEMTQNRVRIVDVADALGLSTATVSKVIHGKTEKISDETVKRVQQELERSGYIPNMAGILLARNNSRIIGVVVNDHEKYEGRVLEDGFVMSSLNALSHEVNEKGYFLMIKTTSDIREIPVFASMWNMDGLILMGFCEADYETLRAQMHISFVVYDGYFEACSKVVNLGIDHYGGGPVGLETLAATVGEEAVTLEDVYEPYLMQMGFLTRTPRGRCVTRLAYEHLGLPFQGQEQLSL